jgi:hypothetical protein
MSIAFDFSAEADLYFARKRNQPRSAVEYRHFSHAVDAIRFAIENLSPAQLVAACLEVDEKRYTGEGIRNLYDSSGFPYVRRAAANS